MEIKITKTKSPKKMIPENELGFGKFFSDHMLIMDYEADYLAYSFMANDVTTYSTLEFNGNTMTLETRRSDNNELLDSLTIERTQEHNENAPVNVLKRIGYKVIEVLGFIYTKIDTLVRKLG